MSPNHNYQRSLILFKDEIAANKLFSSFLDYIELNNSNVKGLIVIDTNMQSSETFSETYQILSRLRNIKKISHNQVSIFLGQTLDFLFIDLRKVFSPNQLCILLESVRGGGIIFILGLPESQWIKSVNPRKFRLEKSNLLNWFIENIQSNSQCILSDQSTSEIISRFNPMPFERNLGSRIEKIPVTFEQKKVIGFLIQDILDSAHPNTCSILVAHRGRGKSASVGIALSEILPTKIKTSFRVIISAPHPTNVQTIFYFIQQGLKEKQIKYRNFEDENGISEIKLTTRVRISYCWPNEINKNLKANIIVFDEAAAIPVDIIKETLKIKSKRIFISTIHGYEGAGRGFQYKILNHLRKQDLIPFSELSLSQPIRFLESDLIEQLLFSTFFLNIEPIPSEIAEKTLVANSTELLEYNDPELLFSKKGASILKNLFGVLISAHYRNQPNDLLMIADSGKHFLTGLYGKNLQENEILLVSSQLAREGSMNEQEISQTASGKFIEGNLIPSIAIRHFSKEFAKLHGLRIVRIASHPNLINKGYGRIAMELLIKRYHLFDWIGVSYGVTVQLMKFWAKFGFNAVHIRPTKTPETGEWNIVVIKPISQSSVQIVERASADFSLQFIALLKQSLYEMKPELAIQILKSCCSISDYKPRITSSGKHRLQNYLKGNLNFLLAIDIMYEIVASYFVSPSEVKLSPSQEILLISRILQGRTWGQTLGKTGLDWKSAHQLLEKAVRKIAMDFL
ncbi:MAG: GNAT family N-acetyltransferase [Candidatus Hodarchaeales archaeon]